MSDTIFPPVWRAITILTCFLGVMLVGCRAAAQTVIEEAPSCPAPAIPLPADEPFSPATESSQLETATFSLG